MLDEAQCERVRRAMDAGTPEAAEILEGGFARNEEVRRASHVEVDEDTHAFLEQCFELQRLRLAVFFGDVPGEREGVSLLRYTSGGLFKRHRDWGVVSSWPDAARRRISVILFLTTSRDANPSGTFSGGALRLFDEDGQLSREIHSEAGTLVAFPSTTLHEVLPVTDGVRDTAVDWFY
jgi:predicted 2-oxoglutarate/Fe(II)-dependent dioxygenase YbiX